ncbi:MAG TPA: class I SAM-dependent methyltransferase [Actinomycetes bacterium]|nr:class I SAM-dependent methyltransferase [Actinomycetes bacterium]
MTDEQGRRIAAVFDSVAATYDTVGVDWFTPIAAGLVRELAPAAGERAVDIGCGRGAALYPLAQAVGPTGHVTALDLSAEMVRLTRADVEARGLRWVDLLVADAASPGLPPGTYDLACASLVLFFVHDPVGALRAWRDLLVPGGRLGISTFGPRDQVWVDVDALFQPYLPPGMLDPRVRGATGPYTSDAGVEGLLVEAGFREVRTVGSRVTARFEDGEHWYRWSRSHAQRAMWDRIPPEELDGVKAAAFALLATVAEPSGVILLTQGIRYTLGERP